MAVTSIFCGPASISLHVRQPAYDHPWSCSDRTPQTSVISFFICPCSKWEDSKTCSLGCGHIPRTPDSVFSQLECEFCENGELQSIQVCNARHVRKAKKRGRDILSPVSKSAERFLYLGGGDSNT